MSLVVALPLGARITGQVVSRRVWLGAAAMVVGIVLFVSAGSSQRGTFTPPGSAWRSASLTAIVLIAVLGRTGHRRRGTTKALLIGSAAGVAFALQASVTKVLVTVVGQGLEAVLTSWTIYVLVVSALAGFLLQQSALKAGVLAAAIESSNAVTLFGSVAFGATFFESLSSGGARPAPALIGLSVALVGGILLAGAKPPKASQGMPRLDQITTSDAREAGQDRGDGSVPRG